MANSVKKSLEKINKVSRHLLSCILVVQNNIQDTEGGIGASKKSIEPSNNTTKSMNISTNTQSHDITNDELTQLMSERKNLITSLFENHSSEDIAVEKQLLNEMVDLDKKLAAHSSICKKVLSEQVVRIKKSKKVKSSYQKY